MPDKEVSFKFISAALAVMAFAYPANGQTSEDKWLWATDGAAASILTANPAAVSLEKLQTSVHQATRTKASNVTGNPNNNPVKITYGYSEKDQGAGVIAPLGGAAFGLDGIFSSGDLKTRTDQSRADLVETLRQKNGQMRFVVALSKELQAAFVYRYHYIERDLLGAFNLSRSENTAFKGSLTGYKMGVFYRNGNYGAGIYNAPALRGKDEIDGEQKIITEQGVVGVDGYLDQKWIRFGLGVQRFYYKNDDRRQLSTSTVTQRRISLNGLDLDQLFFKTQRVMLGFDLLVQSQMMIRATVAKTTGSWLFNADDLPDDKAQNQETLEFNTARLGLRFENQDLHFELGLERETRSFTELRDGQGNLGFGTYADYQAKSDTVFISLSFMK